MQRPWRRDNRFDQFLYIFLMALLELLELRCAHSLTQLQLSPYRKRPKDTTFWTLAPFLDSGICQHPCSGAELIHSYLCLQLEVMGLLLLCSSFSGFRPIIAVVYVILLVYKVGERPWEARGALPVEPSHHMSPPQAARSRLVHDDTNAQESS